MALQYDTATNFIYFSRLRWTGLLLSCLQLLKEMYLEICENNTMLPFNLGNNFGRFVSKFVHI
jgi:hypothetical protein